MRQSEQAAPVRPSSGRRPLRCLSKVLRHRRRRCRRTRASAVAEPEPAVDVDRDPQPRAAGGRGPGAVPQPRASPMPPATVCRRTSRRCSIAADASFASPNAALKATALQEITAEELNAPAANTIDFGRTQRTEHRLAADLAAPRRRGSLRAWPDPYSLYCHDAAAPAATRRVGGQLGLFVNGSLGNGDKDETAFEAAYDFEATGVTVGVDYRFTDSPRRRCRARLRQSDTDFYDQRGGSLDADGVTGLALRLLVRRAGTRRPDRRATAHRAYDSVRRVTYTLGEEPITDRSHGHRRHRQRHHLGRLERRLRASARAAGESRPPRPSSYLKASTSTVSPSRVARIPNSTSSSGSRTRSRCSCSSRLDLGVHGEHVAGRRCTPYARVSAGLGAGERPADASSSATSPIRSRPRRRPPAVTSDDLDDSFVLWADRHLGRVRERFRRLPRLRVPCPASTP